MSKMLETSASTQSSKRGLNSSTPSKNGESPNSHFPDEESMLSMGGSVSYRSSIGPRSVIIQRGSYNNTTTPSSGGSRMQKVMSGYSLQSNASPNPFSLISSTGMNTVKVSSDKGKKDMQDLNERFACYIEKMRFLEAQNSRLIEELKRLKTKWGKETSQVKVMYHAELDEARKLLNDTLREKSRFEIKVASMEEYSEETSQKLEEANRQSVMLKEFVEKQNHQLNENDSEMGTLRRHIDSLEGDRARDKKALTSFQSNLDNARNDLDNEMLLHIDAENRRQSLEEEMAFLHSVHEQEMKELAALTYKDSNAENREYWKGEMGQALKDIQVIYDEKLADIKGDIELFYNRKVQDMRTGGSRLVMEAVHSKEESKRLRVQISELKERSNNLESKNSQLERDMEVGRREAESREKDVVRENEDLKVESARLKAEIESMLFELQSIVDAKLGLELEIAAYRKLLEVEENRPARSLKNVVDGEGGITGAESDFYSVNSNLNMGGVSSDVLNNSAADFARESHSKPTQPMKGEIQARTTYQKSAKGPLSVSECSPDGRYIVVDNTSRKVESLAGWKVVRVVDSNKRIEFVFKEGSSLDANSKIKVWAKGSMPEGECDLVCQDESWGVGANITTKLYNPSGEEKACHTQKTSYL